MTNTIAVNRHDDMQLSLSRQEPMPLNIEVEKTGKVVINGIEYKIEKLAVGDNEFISNNHPSDFNPQQIRAIHDLLQETLRQLITSSNQTLEFKNINTINIAGKAPDVDVNTDKDSVHTKVRVTADTCNNLFNAFVHNTRTVDIPESDHIPETRTRRRKKSQPLFPQKFRGLQLAQSDLFNPKTLKLKSGKLSAINDTINTLHDEVEKLEKIKSDHKKCNELYNYLQRKITEIEHWKKNRTKQPEAIQSVFNIQNSHLSELVHAAEQELAIQ